MAKTKRTAEAIAQEYARVCAELGDLVYRRDYGIPAAIADLMERAKALNLEASQAKPTPAKE